MSFFCPTLGHRDENRFSHSTPDDGLLRTVHNWVSLARAISKPTDYKRRDDIPTTPALQSIPAEAKGSVL